MNRFIFILIGLMLFCSSALALSKREVKNIIEEAYPGARITEIERETYKGKKIDEVDFRHDGQKLEAIINPKGEIVHVGIDD